MSTKKNPFATQPWPAGLELTVLSAEGPDAGRAFAAPLPGTLYGAPAADTAVNGLLEEGSSVQPRALHASGCWVQVPGTDGSANWCHLSGLVPRGGLGVPWLVEATREIGVGRAHHKQRVDEYIRGLNPQLSLKVDWCACFLHWCMKRTNSPYVDDGFAVKWGPGPGGWGENRPDPMLKNALPGDIAIGEREAPNSGLGHITIFIARVGDRLLVLGGNQGENPLVKEKDKRVRYSWYPEANTDPYGKLLWVRHLPKTT